MNISTTFFKLSVITQKTTTVDGTSFNTAESTLGTCWHEVTHGCFGNWKNSKFSKLENTRLKTEVILQRKHNENSYWVWYGKTEGFKSSTALKIETRKVLWKIIKLGLILLHQNLRRETLYRIMIDRYKNRTKQTKPKHNKAIFDKLTYKHLDIR